jgi:cysteine desulfurase/selenocysteine lyase
VGSTLETQRKTSFLLVLRSVCTTFAFQKKNYMYDVMKVREDFPILTREIYGRPLVYLDNGATTQKPRQVVEAMVDEYYNVNANVHRGVHFLSQQATDLHEASRETVRRFINARSTNEILFTRGTTESINLLAFSFGEAMVKEGDEVVVSTMEHHSNIVPWQMMCGRKGAQLRVIPMTDEGELRMDALKELLTERTRIVCVTQMSNVLGTVNPVKEVVKLAHERGIPVLVDGAQSVPHQPVDVQELDCDFFAFSGHKVYGPTGVGVLYGKEEWLEKLPPYQGGGEMIQNVTFEKTTYNGLPYKFEAGTPDYVATHGLAKALEYVSGLGMENIAAHEQELMHYALQRLNEIEGMRIFGSLPPAPEKGEESLAPVRGAVISFLVGNIHHLDMGTLLDRLGIAVRTGHHCAEPLMRRLGIEGTVRASFALYNTKEEVDVLVEGIERVRKMF